MSEKETEYKLPLDIELQYHILKMMTESEAFLVKCSVYIKDDYFANYILGWFFQFLCDYYRTYKQGAVELTIRNELMKFPPEDRPKYEAAFDRIIASKYANEEYLRRELTGWLQSRMFVKLHKTMEELYNQNKRQSAYETTQAAIQDLRLIDFEEERRLHFDNLKALMDEAEEINKNKIPIGVPEIDNAMMGGLPSQSVTTILGDTNVGKTVFCINLAYHAVMRGHKTMFLYHEGVDVQFRFRVLSRFTGIPYMSFYNGYKYMTSEEKSKCDAANTLIEEYLYIRPWQKCGLTIDDVTAFAKQKKVEFDYHLLINDYAQLLRVRTPNNEVRHNQSEVWRDLSALSAELNIAIVTPAQGNRAAAKDIMAGKRLLGITDIAECYDIARASECVITLTRTHDDEVNNKIKILLAKNRDGVRNIAVEAKTDYTRLITHDSTLPMKSLRLSEGLSLVADDAPVVDDTVPLVSDVTDSASSSVTTH